MAPKITYDDKEASKTPTLPPINDVRDVDMNEIKTVVNLVVTNAEPVGNLLGTGVVSGGYISTTFGTTVYAIAAGTGYHVDNFTDPENPVITPVSWAAKTDITPSGLLTLNTQFIGIDINGDLKEWDMLPSQIEQRDYIYLGKLLIDETLNTTRVGLSLPRMSFALDDQVEDLSGAIGVINASGNEISANGANMKFDRAEGITHRESANYLNSYKNPSTITTVEDLAFTFSANYRSVTPGLFINETPTDTLLPDFWDDENNLGTLQAVPAGKFTLRRVYFFTNGATFITYGQVLYDTFNEALSGVTSEAPEVEEQFTVDASLRAIVVVKSGATSLLDARSAKIAPADRFSNVSYPGGALTLDFKSASFASGSVGQRFTHGYYDAPAADTSLTQASPTQSYGSANLAYGAHAFLVAGGIGTASGGVGAVEIEVSGTSITSAGVRTPGDTEIIVADVTTLANDAYYETSKKWNGPVVYTIQNAAGSTQTAFTAGFNYGFAKYEDWGNRAVTVTDFEIQGTAGANDTGFNVELLKHSATGWTYSAGAFIPGDGNICDLLTDYGAESNLGSGKSFAYKRTDLETPIAGNESEGLIVRITTGTNNSVENSDIHIGVEFV